MKGFWEFCLKDQLEVEKVYHELIKAKQCKFIIIIISWIN